MSGQLAATIFNGRDQLVSMSKTFPPCGRDATPDTRGITRTVVAKVRGSSDAIQWASVQTGVGQTTSVVVSVHFDTHHGTPLVYTVPKPRKPDCLANLTSRLKRSMAGQLHQSTQRWSGCVHWIAA